jgi:hypothetical protein
VPSEHTDPYTPSPAPVAPMGTGAGTGKVVVAAGDSAIGRAAVDHAAIEARLRDCPLLLVDAGRLAPRIALLNRLCDRIHACTPGVEVTVRSVVGTRMDEALLTSAGPEDLIVVGRPRRSLRRDDGPRMGSRVAARHPGPVLVVRAADWPTRREAASRAVVVRSDASAAAERAAEFAVREAAVRGCDVVLLHVVTEPDDAADFSERRGGVTVRHRTVVGDPVTELIDSSAHACAVVLGRAAGRRPDPVNSRVLSRTRCPAFLIGSG